MKLYVALRHFLHLVSAPAAHAPPGEHHSTPGGQNPIEMFVALTGVDPHDDNAVKRFACSVAGM